MLNNTQMYEEKLKRLETAVSLTEADRVPFVPKVSGFLGLGYGISYYDIMKDFRNVQPGVLQYVKDYDPDLTWVPSFFPIDPLNALDAQTIRWPGPKHSLPLDSSFQCLDGTYMEDDEFEEFLLDPTHFILTKVLPRKYHSLKGFNTLNFQSLHEMGFIMGLVPAALPNGKEAFENMLQTAKYALERAQQQAETEQIVREAGFPVRGSLMLAPFDMYADNLRGLIQSTMDVLLMPDETEAVVERIADITIDRMVASSKAKGEQYIFIPLHAGVDEFMSVPNYEKFYWPSLKRLINAIVDAGMTPCAFCEGKYDTRLDIISDVPKGKVIYMFEQINIKRAKETVGKVACICGNMDTALLAFGKKEQVIDETRRLLDICAPGGGFIMDCSITIDNAKHENMMAWKETTLKYGMY